MYDSELQDLDLFGSEGIAGFGEEKGPQFNDVDAAVRTPVPSPPGRPSSPSFYDPWICTLSPVGTDIFTSDGRSSSVRNESNQVNAVHMHVQENARIPNYNRPVDRSNSSTNRHRRGNSFGTDVLLSSKPKQDNSMAEMFLSSESRYRRSLNQTYEVLGSLTTEDSNIQKEIDELAAVSVDPTPWSEIQNQIHIEEEQEKQHRQAEEQNQHPEQLSVPTSAPLPTRSEKVPVAAIHPHQSSYYPYDRHNQLPIPERSPPPRMTQNNSPLENDTAGQAVSGMAEAIATAAAIARTNSGGARNVDNSTSTASGANPTPTPSLPAVNQNKIQGNNSYAHQPGLPNATFPKTLSPSRPTQMYSAKDGKSAFTNRHLHRQRANTNPPPHAAAHSVSRASVLAATSRKSQYGFGGNHTVPSVPAPPSIRSSKQPVLRQKTTWKNKQTPKRVSSTTYSVKNHIPAPRLPSTNSNERHPTPPIETNSGSAYERKKQKAKDARVKLNESIERLAIAVSLAGSQSKHRIDQLENRIMTTNCRQKSIEVNQEGFKIAESAKKWDRPSFVGTAASVIQSLNAQCEALMAELMALQQILDEDKKINGDSNGCSNIKSEDSAHNHTTDETKTRMSPFQVATIGISKHRAKQAGSPTPHQVLKRYQQSIDLGNSMESRNKRPRMGIKTSQNQLSNDEVVFGSIARMLDPASLCRCVSTAKQWRDMNAFKDENVWLNLAVKRFGYFNVRKWSENLKDAEYGELPNKTLYEEMNASNVMPHFQQEGLSYLGNGRIQGKLSGWVFIVERSNGETLRSVKRDPRLGVSGGVSYQSRPVVELRIVIQNTGMATQPVILKSQKVGVDVSTRRRGGEFGEIYWDDRFKKVVRNMDGTIRTISTIDPSSNDDLCRLELFEAAVIEVHVNAKGCSTTSKFRQRSNFTKLLASLDGTTIPMVIPFLKHDGML
jgi:hypothetical protein